MGPTSSVPSASKKAASHDWSVFMRRLVSEARSTSVRVEKKTGAEASGEPSTTDMAGGPRRAVLCVLRAVLGSVLRAVLGSVLGAALGSVLGAAAGGAPELEPGRSVRALSTATCPRGEYWARGGGGGLCPDV